MKETGLSSSFTLALQTLSDDALADTNRRNMRVNEWPDLVDWLRTRDLQMVDAQTVSTTVRHLYEEPAIGRHLDSNDVATQNSGRLARDLGLEGALPGAAGAPSGA